MKKNKNLSAEQAGTEPKQPLQNIPEETTSSGKNILPQMEQNEIPPINETEILEIKNTEINDMEVHHHSHERASTVAHAPLPDDVAKDPFNHRSTHLRSRISRW